MRYGRRIAEPCNSSCGYFRGSSYVFDGGGNACGLRVSSSADTVCSLGVNTRA